MRLVQGGARIWVRFGKYGRVAYPIVNDPKVGGGNVKEGFCGGAGLRELHRLLGSLIPGGQGLYHFKNLLQFVVSVAVALTSVDCLWLGYTRSTTMSDPRVETCAS